MPALLSHNSGDEANTSCIGHLFLFRRPGLSPTPLKASYVVCDQRLLQVMRSAADQPDALLCNLCVLVVNILLEMVWVMNDAWRILVPSHIAAPTLCVPLFWSSKILVKKQFFKWFKTVTDLEHSSVQHSVVQYSILQWNSAQQV